MYMNRENNFVNIDDFAKLELRVGLIKEAETVEGSNKLIKCKVDFGDLGERTVVSGIAKYKDPEDMINKKYLYITNLEPRTIFGIESEGMLVALHSEDDSFSMLIPENDGITPGTKAS